nr:virulence RhuM family protein [Bifidobacterium rousetti]
MKSYRGVQFRRWATGHRQQRPGRYHAANRVE